MGRPERPVDPAAGPVQRLAHELRELRRAAGGPSYRTMAETAGFSATTLSQAAAGERLPSLPVVQGYVRACGADPAEWEPRWKEAEAEAAGAPVYDEGRAPYRGLARFEPDDQELFFGRDRLVDEVRELVCDHRFAVLFGASGSGKSSLLRAGLIPSLRKKIADLGRPAVLRVLTPGDRPATTYGPLLAPAEGEPESWVVVDQFEEVFTLCRDRAERARFIELLLAARKPDSRLRTLIAVRADFYARCAEHRELADALRGSGLLVGPMTADELRDAVVKPAQAVGLLVERELTARIVEEVLDRPGGLPMLSHALLETWRRRRGRMLTLAAYESAGGVRGAIAATAEEAYGQLPPARARTARHLLLRLVEPGDRGTPDTRRPIGRAELDEWPDPEVPVVVERLARARLLTVDEEGVQLAHEALISGWPRLRDWIEQDRDRLRHHRRLAEAARTWLEHDRDPGTLYRGTRLARAEELFAEGPGGGGPGAGGVASEAGGEYAEGAGGGGRGVLTATEKAFLTAALEARDAERLAAARTARRSRLLATALSSVLAVALIAGLAAWQQGRDNERRRTETAARRIAAVADSLRTTDPRTAMLLGLAAWRVAPLPETRRALLGALAQPESGTFSDPAPGDSPRRFLADSGRTLLSVEGRTWRTWDVATHRPTASGRLTDGADVLAASPDARTFAVSTENGVRLWDAAAGRWTGAPDPLPHSAVAGFGAGHGHYLESSIDDDRVRLRSVTDGTVLFETRAPGQSAVALSADGRRLAYCPSGRSPRLWDTGSRRHLPGDWEKAGAICDERAMLVYGDGDGDGDRDGDRDGGAGAGVGVGVGRFAAVTGTDVRVWDTRSGRRVADLDDPGVQYASFSGDGAFLATSDGREIRVWRLVAPAAPVFRHSLNNQRLYGGLAWDPERPALRYLEGGTVHTLDLSAATTSAWRDHPLAEVRLSPDGRTYATAELTGTRYVFRLHATRGGRPPRTLPQVPLPVSLDPAEPVVPRHTLPVMAFSPDGTAFAYGVSAPGREAAPQRLVLWDLAHDRRGTVLDLAASESAGAVVAVALGPGGRTLHATRTPAIGELRNEVWDTGRQRRTAVLPGMDSSHLAVSPDGERLVGDHRTARLPSGRVGEHDLIQGDQVGALAFSPDGSVLAAGDQTGRVALWDGTLRRRVGILPNMFPVPHRGAGRDAEAAPQLSVSEGVQALAVSPDGRTLAVGGDHGTLQLWDIATQQPLGGPLPTPGEAIASLAFSPDSGTLYAGSAHVPVQRHTIAPARAVTGVCARVAGVELTRDQWRTHVPDMPYRRVCEP
ncbi:hypothetical protein [Streptomyces sp. TRM64462]|uniref:nSTAND1 domain-containing NTPase n=1 Tax=Streptomyces sp. TRM64462 TaxID=2741726 RepID=UPI001585EF46|nr:hypothetical protein [Streptomyces sp. TRM64462]